MIVLRREGRLLLFKQLDHAALAGELAAEWGNAGFEAPEPRASVLLAAARHDEGWRGSDDDFGYDPERRAPLSFLDVGLEEYVTLYGAGIDRVAEADPYAGLLTSMHGTGNLCGRWGRQPGARLSQYDQAAWAPGIERFVLEQEALQARLKLRLFGIGPTEPRSTFERRLWFNWDLLQCWDRLSLFACRTEPGAAAEAALGEAPTSSRSTQTATLTVRTAGPAAVAIDPWPFTSAGFEVEIPYRTVEDRPYNSQQELATAATAAPIQHLRWRLQPGTHSPT